MTNLNPYNELEFKSLFQHTEIGKRLFNEYDIVSWDKNLKIWSQPSTPREWLCGDRIFSVVPFYYLGPLLEKQPDIIYDLGCGFNIFKKYIPNIIGVSPTKDLDGYGDIHDIVDDVYIQGHQNFFNSVFSINALHFASIEHLKKQIVDFISMVKVGGRGFLALNLQRMLDLTSQQYLTNTFGKTPTQIDYENFVHSVVDTIDCNFLIVDIDFTTIDDRMDGNIRLVFEK